MSWQPCRLLFHYAAAGWKDWVLIVAATLGSTGLGLLRPWPMKIVVDHVLARQPMAAPLAPGFRLARLCRPILAARTPTWVIKEKVLDLSR